MAKIGDFNAFEKLLDIKPATPQQKEIIEYKENTPIFVNALAGSGKTDTISRRIAYQIFSGTITPSEVLALTFTNKAAGELKERIRKYLNIVYGDISFEFPYIATYDSFFADFFKSYCLYAEKDPDYILLDDIMAFDIASKISLSQEFEECILKINKPPATIAKNIISLSKDKQMNFLSFKTIEDFVQKFKNHVFLNGDPGDCILGSGIAKNMRDIIEILDYIPLLKEFASIKKKLNYYSYDDILFYAYKILDTSEASDYIKDSFSEKYKLICFDEYQDTSAAQCRFLSRLFKNANIMAVGDKNQGIYGWRGATSSNIDNFACDFSDNPSNIKIFDLSYSFRCPKEICDIANKLLKIADEQVKEACGDIKDDIKNGDYLLSGGKKMLPFADISGSAESKNVHIAQNVLDIPLWIASQAKSILQSDRAQPQTIAVLCRKRDEFAPIAKAFAKENIDYEICAKNLVFDTPETNDLLCILNILFSENPNNYLIRILSSVFFSVELHDLKELYNFTKKYYSFKIKNPLKNKINLYWGLKHLTNECSGNFTPLGFKKLLKAKEIFLDFEKNLYLNTYDLAVYIIKKLNLDIELIANETIKKPFEKINMLLQKISDYSSVYQNHKYILANLNALNNLDIADTAPDEENAGKIKIMTIHASKGLEFDYIFYASEEFNKIDPGNNYAKWSQSGHLPRELFLDSNYLPKFLWKDISAENKKQENDAIYKLCLEQYKTIALKEEYNAAYVAFTRAKKKLFLAMRPKKERQKSAAAADYDYNNYENDILDYLDSYLNKTFDNYYPFLPFETEGVSRFPRLQHIYQDLLEISQASKDYKFYLDKIQNQALKNNIEILIQETLEPIKVYKPKNFGATQFIQFFSENLGSHSFNKSPLKSISAKSSRRDLNAVPRNLANTSVLSCSLYSIKKPYKNAGLGTLIHEYIEKYYHDLTPAFVEFENLRVDNLYLHPKDKTIFKTLIANFKACKYAALKPKYVEIPLNIALAGCNIKCQLDAVFEIDDRYKIIDWKSGAEPNEKDMQNKKIQLSVYSLALAKYLNIDINKIDASFYYLRVRKEISPVPYKEKELEEIIKNSFIS